MSTRVFAAFVLAALPFAALAEEPVALPRTSIRHLKAEANGVGYKLYVSLPSGYDASKERYPVIYVLDADYSFAIAHNVVEHLADRNDLRWSIVVGIAYDGPPQYRLNRTRDYTPTHSLEAPDYQKEYQKVSGGGAKFRQFLAKELVPYIDANFRTTGERILVGHSYGGLFATWVLLSEELFRGYVIVSPSYWYDDEMIFKTEAAVKSLPHMRVYIAAGAMENPIMGRDARRMARRLRRFESVEVRDEVPDGETHNSIFPTALSRGLRFVMNGR